MAKKTVTKKTTTKKKTKQEDLLGFNLSKVEKIKNYSENGQVIEMDVSKDGKELMVKAQPKENKIWPKIVFICVVILLSMWIF
jgi:hypothetical protein